MKLEKADILLKEFKSNQNLGRELEKEYLKALKDEKFKDLVDHLKSSKDVLKKYTSLLEDSSIEYHNCKMCKNIMECKNKKQGYAYLPKVSGEFLEFCYQACKYTLAYLKETSYLNNVTYFNAKEELKRASMKNIDTSQTGRLEVIRWLKQFLDNYPNTYKGLYLHGNFGCGKSYLISALFNELGKRKVEAAILFWPEFLTDLKSSLDSDFIQKFNYVKKVPLLLIDDIGAENTTTFTRDEVLCPILQYRMDEHLPTFFTSNLSLEVLERHLSISKDGYEVVKARRIIERIKQLADIKEMISVNLRK